MNIYVLKNASYLFVIYFFFPQPKLMCIRTALNACIKVPLYYGTAIGLYPPHKIVIVVYMHAHNECGSFYRKSAVLLQIFPN